MKAFFLALISPYLTLALVFFIHSHMVGQPVVSKTVQVLNVAKDGNIEEKDIVIDELFKGTLDFKSVHAGLPFTRKKDLKPCSDFFDVEEQLTEALQCANAAIFSKPPYTSSLARPKMAVCNVILTTSPDVRETPDFNYINLDLFGKTLAFYDTQTQEIFLVETYDMKMILRHELQHHFLTLKDGGERCDHCHEIWNKCEAPRYTPSPESVSAGKDKGTSLFYKIFENFQRDFFQKIQSL